MVSNVMYSIFKVDISIPKFKFPCIILSITSLISRYGVRCFSVIFLFEECDGKISLHSLQLFRHIPNPMNTILPTHHRFISS